MADGFAPNRHRSRCYIQSIARGERISSRVSTHRVDTLILTATCRNKPLKFVVFDRCSVARFMRQENNTPQWQVRVFEPLHSTHEYRPGHIRPEAICPGRQYTVIL